MRFRTLLAATGLAAVALAGGTGAAADTGLGVAEPIRTIYCESTSAEIVSVPLGLFAPQVVQCDTGAVQVQE
ncbi:hypothetical protein ACFWTE_13965 [Nocardiopsis sp. NPDC058631]|uniref:hypothetical protein n=1 Tax=Nocardiopsis sp. NPDC058631 TaxID=3346566 RepID=UPI003659546E